MALKKHNFTPGDTIFAQDFNELENSIQNELDGKLSLSGGTLTEKLSITDGGNKIELLPYGGIEISGTIPYIDFHFNDSNEDYTSRIIEFQEGCLSVWSKDTNRNGYIETIVSSSGDHVRYGNGLQLVWGYVDVGKEMGANEYGTTNWTYPMPFAFEPRCFFNSRHDRFNVGVNVGPIGTTGTQLYYVNTSASNSFFLSGIDCFAIGYWK